MIMTLALLLGEICFREQQYLYNLKSLVMIVSIVTGLFVMGKFLIRKFLFRSFWIKSRLRLSVLFGVVAFFVGGFRMQDVEENIQTIEQFCVGEENYIVTGEVASVLENGIRLKYVTIAKMDWSTYIVLDDYCLVQIFISDFEMPGIGQQITVTGEFVADLLPRNEGEFNRKEYYYSLGIYACFNGDGDSVAVAGEPGSVIRGWLQNLQGSMERQLYQLTGEREASVLAAILLGSKENIDEETNELYQLVGIAHILSVSGLHVSVVGMCIYRLLRKRFGFLFSGGVGGVFVCAFSLMTGYGLSTKRAMIMFLVMIGGEILGRTYDMLSALSLAAMVVLWETPYAVTGTSMQLSFGAVIGIAAVGREILTFLQVKNKIIKSFVMSESINLVTRPILIQSYYQIATMSTVLNLLVLPVFSVVLYGGLAGILISYVNLNMGKILIQVPVWILKGYEVLGEVYMKLPYGVVIVGNQTLEELLCYYAVLIGSMIIICWRNRAAKRRELQDNRIINSTWHRRFVVICYVVLTILTFKGREEDNCVKMLDVGQGDCIYLETKGGLHMLIDGGSSSASEVGKYTILPFLKYNGVRKLDYVIVTHADKDHISGIVEMLEEERAMVPMIEHLILPDIPMVLRDDSYLKVEMLAKQKGCEVLYFSTGNGISYKDFSLMCLFPSKDIQAGGKWDKNELSLVCQVELNNTKFLFTGDLGALGEEWLLEHHLIGSVSVLKVGHHGSKHSSSMEFLAKVMPEIALISCGKDNVYGHPGVETLERLEEVKSAVWNTVECGQIVVRVDEASEQVWTRRMIK